MDLETTIIYDLFWQFAFERQNVFFKRFENRSFPWTDDKIICKHKFTNAYRASDRVSQYLIRNVIYNDSYSPEDLCFRILFFKLFNKIETWEYMIKQLGDISFSTYNYELYNRLLFNRISERERIYSAAYIMPSGKSFFGNERKHQNNLKLLELIMSSGFSKKLAKVRSLQELYSLLLSFPTLGSFLAFQYAIDINYSELCDFSEMSFVVSGPGAKSGIRKCFKNLNQYNYEDIIRYVAENQEEEFNKRNLNFKNLFGRKLQLIDCQNLFCETDKYSRAAYPDICGLNNRTRIKQHYSFNSCKKFELFYPPKWGINTEISLYRRG